MPISSIDHYTTYNEAGITYNELGYPYLGIASTIILPDPFSMVLSLPESTVPIGIIIEASTLNLLLNFPTTSVETTSNVSVSPDALSLIISTPQSSVSIATLVELGVLSLSASVQSPTISTVRNVFVSPDILNLLVSLQSPSIQATENLNLSIVPKMSIFSARPNATIKDVAINSVVSNVKMQVYVGDTEGQIFDQQLTYNEAGYTYNDIRANYGGFYGNSTVKRYPQFIKTIKPIFS